VQHASETDLRPGCTGISRSVTNDAVMWYWPSAKHSPNAAEFAYLDIPGRGTIAFTASYDEDIDALAVTVTDRGRWRPTGTSTAPAHHALRGRGIPLMRALAGEIRIDTSERGTQACLMWTNLLSAPTGSASG
jgi:Histidine kinase-like ATPase domain